LARPHSLLSANRIANPANHTAAVVWSDDFSNPSTWTMASESSTSDNWIIDAVGPTGSFSIGPINSTSAANGWATFDSDLLCSGDQIADLTNATAINCTGHAAVNLKYEEYYRRFFDSTFVNVSNDGINWTQFSVHSTFINNDATANPNLVTLDISSVAGNQATVWIQFQFYSTLAMGSNAGCGYAWEIDDVSIEDIPADDIGIVPSFPSPYTMIPLSQAQPIPLSLRINNVGTSAETNVGFTSYVFQIIGGNPTLIQGPTLSNTAANLLPGDTTVTLTAGNWTAPDTGVYAFLYIDLMTNSDANGLNDTLVQYIIIDDSTYARDYTSIDGMVNGGLGSTTGAIIFAQDFNVYAARSVSSATYFQGAATLGDTVSVSIYSVTGAGVPNVVLGTTGNHIISPADTNQFVTLAFVPGIPVAAGGRFAIAFKQFSAANNAALGYDNSIYTPAQTFYKAGASAWASLDATTFHIAFVLRPNLNLSTGIAESDFSKNLMIYPNPSNGKIYINSSDNSASGYVITIFNSIGEVVTTQTHSNLMNAVVDLSAQANGVYTMQIKSSEGIVTKSFVISNNK
jgi:hypothetical protein